MTGSAVRADIVYVHLFRDNRLLLQIERADGSVLGFDSL